MFTDTVQLAVAAKVAVDKLTEPEPGSAVAVPPHVLFRLFGFATTNPAGRLSVKAIPLSATFVFGLLMVNVSDVVPFNGICAAPKALAIVGGLATVRFDVAVLPVPPLVELTLPVVLVYWPADAPVTVTENWHWLLVLIVAPVNAIPVGLVVVSVPPHTVADALATVNPVGSVSVNATPVNGSGFAPGLVMVKVSDVVAFSVMVDGLNTFAMEGGASTFTLADA